MKVDKYNLNQKGKEVRKRYRKPLPPDKAGTPSKPKQPTPILRDGCKAAVPS